MFGRKPRLPIDLILSPTDDANEDHSHSKFVEDWKTQMSEAYQKTLQNSSHRKEKDIARHEMIKKLSPVLEQGDRVLIRNMSERGGTGKMRSFWEEKVHVVVENINNENITYKVKPERDTDGRTRVLHRNMLLPCDNLLDNFNWNINTQPTHEKQNKKTASRQLPKKNDNKDESVTENEDDGSETGEMIEFTPREIQTFSKENSDKIGKKEKEGQKVDEKVDFSIELEKSGQELRREKVVRPKGNEKMIVIDDGSEYCEIEGQKVDEKVDFPIESEKNERELPREKVVRPKGNEKMIVIDDGSEYCETEGRKMEDKDQGGIGRNRKKPGRIKKVITVEDGPAFCKKKWKQTAASDPDNTKQTSSSGSRPRRIEDSICITDPEHLKKNVGKRVSYEQRKENQSRKQYSLRSKAKEQKEKSDIGSSETPSMSSRKPTSTMETNEISVCAKSVSPDMKAPTE